MELLGLILFIVGLGVIYLARRTEGVSGAAFFLLGLVLVGLAIYWIFFEEGKGLTRWIEGLGR